MLLLADGLLLWLGLQGPIGIFLGRLSPPASFSAAPEEGNR